MNYTLCCNSISGISSYFLRFSIVPAAFFYFRTIAKKEYSINFSHRLFGAQSGFVNLGSHSNLAISEEIFICKFNYLSDDF